jgi:hypothetical protein
MLKGKFMSTVKWSMRRNTRTRSARVTQIRASAKGRKLEIWADKDGNIAMKWNMEVAIELIVEALELGKAPPGADSKKMTAAPHA